MTWPHLRKRLESIGYTHARCEGQGLAWRPTVALERLVAAARAVSDAPVPARFDGRRVDAMRLGGLRERLDGVLDALDAAESGRHGLEPSRLYDDAASLTEPFLAKLLVLLDEEAMWRRTEPGERLDLKRLTRALQTADRSPFERSMVMNDEVFESAGRWVIRDTLHHALREDVQARNIGGHGAPDPGMEAALRTAWCAVVIIMAIVERNIEDIGVRVPSAVSALGPGQSWDEDDLREVRARLDDLQRGALVRDAALAHLESWIDQQVDGGYLLVVGPQGLGKSTVMAQLAKRLESSGCSLVHFVAAQRDPVRILRSLQAQARQLQGAHSRGVPGSGSIDCWREELVRALEGLARQRGRAVVLIDGLDELETVGPPDLTFLPRSLPSGVRAVLATRPDQRLLRQLRLRLTRQSRFDLPPLSMQDFRLMLERRLEASVARRLPDAELARVFASLDGNALLLGWAIQQLGEHWEALSRGAAVPEIAGSLQDFFQAIYDDVRARGEAATRALKVLCVARAPLGRAEVSVVSGAGPEVCSDALDQISERLREINGRFEPFHQGLREYVLDVVGVAGRRELEAAFCAWLTDDAASRYALDHRIDHLLAANRAEEAARVLLSPEFLEARAAAQLAARIPADLVLVAGQLSPAHELREALDLIAEAVRMDLHFVQRHPEALFQCLWNRASWHNPIAAAPVAGFSLRAWLERWRERRSNRASWCRALLPPSERLGAGHYSSVPIRFAQDAFVPHLALDDDGRALVAIGSEAFVVDLHTGATVQHVTVPAGWFLTHAFSDARRVVLDSGNVYRVLDVSSDQLLQETTGADPGGGDRHALWSSDARRLAVTTSWEEESTGVVSVYDADGHELRRLNEFSRHFELLALSPHGRLLCLTALPKSTHFDDETEHEWETIDQSGERLLLVDVDTGAELSLADGAAAQGVFSADGSRLAVLGHDPLWVVFDTSTGAQLASGAVGDGHCLSLSPDGRFVAIGGSALVVFDVETGERLRSFPGTGREVASPSFSPDGRWLATAHFGVNSGTVRLWDLERMPGESQELAAGPRDVFAFDLADDGRVATLHDDGSIGVWSSRTAGEEIRLASAIRFHHGGSVRWLGPSRLLVTFSTPLPTDKRTTSTFVPFARSLMCVDATAAVLVSDSCLGDVAVSVDGRWIAFRSPPTTIVVWDSEAGQCLALVEGPRAGGFVLAVSSGGQRVAALTADSLSVWSLQSAGDSALAWSVDLPPMDSGDLEVEFSRDGERLRACRGSGPPLVLLASTGEREQSSQPFPTRPPERFSVRAEGTETVIQEGNRVVAWCPAFSGLAQVRGTTIAGLVDRHLAVFNLEALVSRRG